MVRVPISETGCMKLPAAVRKRMGLSGSGTVFLEESKDGVVLLTIAQVVARAQGLARRYTGETGGSAEFIANRRADLGE
jgi:hypothetical protein